MVARPSGTTERHTKAAEGTRLARHRARAGHIAVGFILGCMTGTSVAWTFADDGSEPTPAPTQSTVASPPAGPVSANAAEQRAAERRADCLTLGTADAVDRCLSKAPDISR